MPPEAGENSRTRDPPSDPILSVYPVAVDDDDRYPTAVRFIGGASDRFANLVAMCQYIVTETPTETALRAWFATELGARESTFDKQVPFIEDLGLISHPESMGTISLTETGDRFLTALDEPGDREYDILFDALRRTVTGFDYLLARLEAGPIPLNQRDTILAEAYTDYQPADHVPIKHYTWLLAIGYIEKHDGAYELTSRGRRALARLQSSLDIVETEPTPPAGLYLVPVSDDWLTRFRQSVVHPHDLSQYETLPPELAGYEQVRIWGTTETDATKKQAAIDQLAAGDYLLFYHDGDFIAGGRIERAFESTQAGSLLWDEPRSRHCYTIEAYTTAVPTVEQVWEWLGYDGRPVVQGFTRVAAERVRTLREEQGPLSTVLLGREPTQRPLGGDEPPTPEAIDADAPKLTDENQQFIEQRRRVRDTAFRRDVRAAYGNRCAVCGRHRTTPDGTPEVEAAHIYPKGAGGRDVVPNGLALCKLHHWAFDSGWLSVSDDYDVLVTEAPDQPGYAEFSELAGTEIHLPDDESHHPAVEFLQKHRRLHGFDEK
ncbi:HNH endonuclease [Halosimplex aquaticum]|uniref:HNH endonuclease n=1 Tax=Halosimplex aquaticum TaxID=3026162 RepID=A0ABD5XYP0_9EURY|nr:HNH endonuclease [Halosimplex aquaticum]